MDVKLLRQRYDPGVGYTKVLFIGESPPCDYPRKFFYLGKGPLFNAVYTVFKDLYNVREGEFLDFFARKGFYLVDLFDEPCVKLEGREKGIGRVASVKEVEEAVQRIRREILSRKPIYVIVVLCRVCKVVKSILKELKTPYTCLPYPLPKNKVIFVSGLKEAIKFTEILKDREALITQTSKLPKLCRDLELNT